MPRPGREARALLAEAATLQSLAATTLNRPEEARGQARSAYDAAVREIVAAQLASMPMARLKETTEGRVRLGAVEAAGLTTVASVMRAGPQRLQGIRGVGPETATKLVAAARVVGKKRVTSRKRASEKVPRMRRNGTNPARLSVRWPFWEARKPRSSVSRCRSGTEPIPERMKRPRKAPLDQLSFAAGDTVLTTGPIGRPAALSSGPRA